MAHFAEIDQNNIVKRVLVVPNEQEHRGSDYLAYDIGLGGTWIQTSYNNNIHYNFAAVGYIWDEINKAFYAPQPYPSWTLDDTFNWQPPIPYPDAEVYDWDEENGNWVIADINY